MKKITLIILATLVLNFGLIAMPVVTTHAENGIYDMKFNVQTNLKLEGQKQPASYFTTDTAGGSPIVSFAKKIIEFATYVIGSIAVILVMIAGFMFMVSQGNQQKLDEAKDIFKYAMIGLIIVFLSYIITIFVQSIFTSGS
jgi:hypothetical protein